MVFAVFLWRYESRPFMIRFSQICCVSLRMELRNFNVNEIVNIPHRLFILILYILAFSQH